ncbi:MAG: amidohydrolase family protein, partial [Chloroflexi bacterium]|nr:amidohydrolase family protein [Chloroflexota bacterium]
MSDLLDRYRWIVVALFALPLLLGIAFLLSERLSGPQPLELDLADVPAEEIRVYVAGAVQRPGVYPLTDGDRWIDALEAAGGPTADANLAAVDLARRARDEDTIRVPSLSGVDVASASQMRLCEGVLAAREATRDLLVIQLVAFPQDGLIRDPNAVDLMRSAIRSGVDLVGGIPHIERTQREGIAHLEQVFDLAAELDADIDVHIDETDDPASRYTEHLASLTIQRGWHGRVTASHVCALASYDDVHAARVMDLLAEADINVITNPGVNLHLQGRFDRYPKRRGLTRVSELLKRGVTCAAGQDCIRDPFYPLGNGKMLDQAFLLVHADHMSSPAQIQQAFEMVC